MMRGWYWIATCVLCFCWPLATVMAQDSDTFIIQTLVGGDTDAPTVPADVVATPVTTTQIDITWSVSYDLVGVDGYQVWRDGVQIATTTATSYNDTGLIASTTYGYQVAAFDASDNFSALSATTSTTTLAEPEEESTTSSSGGGSGGDDALAVNGIAVIPEQQAVEISFSTTEPTAVTVRWGLTADFELGYSSSDIMRTNHNIRIDNLDPDTLYYVDISAQNEQGETVDAQKSFMTLEAADTVPPPNIVGFAAEVVDGEVILSWAAPSSDDIAGLRVMSSPVWYPQTSSEGFFVYDGLGVGYTDTSPFTADRYYTAFAYDAAGNISSGAVAFASFPTSDVATSTTAEDSDNEDEDDESFDSGLTVTGTNGLEQLEAGDPLIFSIPYDSVPERSKTITVTLTEPDTGRSFSFLLRSNDDFTAYEASLSGLNSLGDYDVEVTVYDYDQKKVTLATSSITINKEGAERDSAVPVTWWWPLPIVLYGLYRLFRWFWF